MSVADSIVVVEGTPEASAPTEQPRARLATVGEVIVDVAPDRGLPPNWPPSAQPQADGSVILHLEYPVRFKLRDADGAIREGDLYETLHLKRLKGKHKLAIAKAADTTGFEKALMAASTGIDAGRIEMLYGEMDQADITAAVRVLTFFTTPGRKTGPAS